VGRKVEMYRPQDGQDWIDTGEAAAILKLTRERVQQMAKKGTLPCYRPPKKRAPHYFLRADVEALATQREEAEAKRRQVAFYKTWDLSAARQAAEEGEEPLLSTREAAAMLEVAPVTLLLMAYRGRIACYQERAGKSGSPLRFARSEVERLAEDRERLKRREAYKRRGRGNGKADDLPYPGYLTPSQTFWSADELEGSPWLTTKQVAAKMGVNNNRILQWVKAGRLRAYRLPRKYYNRPPWCFLKTDIEALMADPTYQRYRARWLEANSPERQEQRELERCEAILEWMVRANGWDDPNYEPAYQAWPGGIW